MSRAWNSAWQRVSILLVLFEVLCKTQKTLKLVFNYKQIVWPTHTKLVLAFPAGLPRGPFVSHPSSSHLQLTLYLRAASNSFSTGSFCLHLNIALSTEHRVLWMVFNFQTMRRSDENNSPNPHSPAHSKPPDQIHSLYECIPREF